VLCVVTASAKPEEVVWNIVSAVTPEHPMMGVDSLALLTYIARLAQIVQPKFS